MERSPQWQGGGSAVLGDGGPAISGQLNYPNSITVDSTGNLFIGEYGRVRKVTPDGIISTVAGGGPNSPGDGGAATSAELEAVMGVAVDAAGDLFIEEGGYDPDSCDTTFLFRFHKVTPDGMITTLAPVPNCCYSGSIGADGAGDLLVSTGNRIWQVSPGGSQTAVAGNGSYGAPSGDGGPAAQAQLSGTTAVAVGPAGDLFIADNSGRTIRRVTSDGIIHTLASIPSPMPTSSGDGGPAIDAQLQLAVLGLNPQSGLAADSSGNLYIAETGANRVRKVSPAGIITTVAGVGCSTSSCLPLGAFPTSVAVDSTGNLFIADSSDLRVRRVTPDGTITTVAGNGNNPEWPGGSGDGGPAVNTPVRPYSVAVDRAGNLFIGEFVDVLKVSPDGTINHILPFNTSQYVEAIAVDANGNLYVAGSNGIQKITPSGDVTLIANRTIPYSLQPGSSIGDGGPVLNAFIGYVSSLAVDAAGNIFVADLIGQRIRKIDVNGIITTVGGDGIPGYSGDGGPATNATINYPFGLATDAAGNVYVSDQNQAVRILRLSTQSQ